jgi:hypothetical protein
MKELYVVYFESANYAGYGEHCLVWAESEDEARENDQVIEWAEEFYQEQDYNQWLEDGNHEDEGPWASIEWAKPVAGSDYEKYVAKQPNLYPIVNTK